MNNRSDIRRIGNVLMVVTCVLALQGCASKPVELAPQATTALESLRSSLLDARTQVQEASNAARDLVEQPRSDLQKQIARLDSSVKTLNATRESARSEAQAQEKKLETYFADWDAQLKTMSEETAEAGQKRLSLAKKSIERLRNDAAVIRTELQPFMADLNEASRYLTTDTTKAGVEVVTPRLKSAIRTEPDVNRAIDKMVATIDAIRAGK